MLFSSSISTLVVLASLLGVSARPPPSGPVVPKQNVIPNRFIVEFDSKDNLQKANLKKRDTTVHESIYAEMRARGLSIKVNQEYVADLFIGASITLNSAEDLASVASIEGVLNILPVRTMMLPSNPKPITAEGWARADPSTLKPISIPSGNSTKSRRQTSARRNTGFSNLPQIKADTVHAQGNKGRGIKIGIIDGGVDYTRTPMGGCFGPGCKVAGGYDFVGDNFVAGTDPVPDSDPIDKCQTHGTIVAGIIGANDNEYNVPGVAPEASLYQYRVFSCTGYSSEDVVFQAMQRAYLEDMDVVNMSFEFKAGWTQTPAAVMASRLVQAGVVVTAAAGNVDVEDNGPFYAMGPAAGRGVISAGAVNSTILPAHNATTSTGYGPITYYNYKNMLEGTVPVYTYPNDPTGCNPPKVDLSNVVLIVREGGSCSSGDKARMAFINGGQRIIFAQSDNTEPIYENFPLIDNGRVSKADGDYLFANAGSVSLTFSYNPAARPNTFTGGIGYEISAQGPTYELFMSTQVLAPGTNIIGVIPFNPNRNFANWTITPGTSWSTAFAAGSAALYLNSRGVNNLQPRTVREALQATANPVQFSRSDSQLHSVAFQGAGVIQAFDSINFGTVVTPSELYLNDTQYFNDEQTIKITNTGRDRKDYRLSNLAAGTALALNPTNNFTNYFPTPQVNAPATVKFSDDSFNLRAGQSKNIKLKFKYPTNVDPKSLPIVSGFIQIQAGDEVSTVPYLGVAQRMGNVPVFDSNDAYFESPAFKLPLTVNGLDGNGFNNNPTFTFVGSSFPALYYRYAGGSTNVYLDLVRADADLGINPTFRAPAKRDMIERDADDHTLVARKTQANNGDWSTSLSGLQRLLCRLTQNRLKFCAAPQSSFAKVPIVGTLFEKRFAVHDTNDFDTGFTLYSLSRPVFANGTRIPNGQYKFLFRGLHVFGNPSNQADYESYVSNSFVINAA